MWLTSWLRPNRRAKKIAARQASRQPSTLSLEPLEDRALLTTTVYLDFGLGLEQAGLVTTVAALRDIDGARTPTRREAGPDLTLPNLFGPGRPQIVGGDDLTLQQLEYDFNNDGDADEKDTLALQNAVKDIVKRALQPFDIDVQIGRANSLNAILTTLRQNNTNQTYPNGTPIGQNDAYIFLGTVSSTKTAGSVALGTQVAGLAAARDQLDPTRPAGTRNNNSDEVVLAFADNILTHIPGAAKVLGHVVGDPATPEEIAAFNKALPFYLAYTAIHEGAHTFGLFHTLGTDADQRLLSSGDQIRDGSNT